jgi:hypothetical protein
MEPPSKNSPYQIIVEGPDDVAFFGDFQTKMVQENQLDDRAWIQSIGGKNQTNKLKTILGALAVRSDPVRSIGLIRDADQDHRTSFLEWKGAVQSVSGLLVPVEIGRFQAAAAGGPRVGILVLPHDRPGIRETLCLEAVSRHPVMSCVDDFMNCVASKGNSPHSEHKSRLLAYLSAQQETDGRVGIAVTKGYIPWNSPAFEILAQFLKELLEPPL